MTKEQDDDINRLLKQAQEQLSRAKEAVDKLSRSNDLKKALTFVLKWEGEYSNDPGDPGGETKWGISKKAYPDEDIKNLTRERALEIYATDYWLASGCDAIPFPANVAVFDTAVNCGVTRAMGWYEQVNCNTNKFLEKRKQHYIDTVNKNPTLIKYARGWWARLADLQKYVVINSGGDGCPG
jgi:hypothetical protein